MKKQKAELPKVVSKNIAHLLSAQNDRLEHRSAANKIAEKITSWFGSASFLFLHFLWFAFWIADNSGVIEGGMTFDPYPFGFLTFVVSLEAIFLSIMVLMVQNSIQRDADRRAELDLHINVLAEQESTLTLKKLMRIEEHLGIQVPKSEQTIANDLIKETDIAQLEKSLEKEI